MAAVKPPAWLCDSTAVVQAVITKDDKVGVCPLNTPCFYAESQPAPPAPKRQKREPVVTITANANALNPNKVKFAGICITGVSSLDGAQDARKFPSACGRIVVKVAGEAFVRTPGPAHATLKIGDYAVVDTTKTVNSHSFGDDFGQFEIRAFREHDNPNHIIGVVCAFDSTPGNEGFTVVMTPSPINLPSSTSNDYPDTQKNWDTLYKEANELPERTQGIEIASALDALVSAIQSEAYDSTCVPTIRQIINRSKPPTHTAWEFPPSTKMSRPGMIAVLYGDTEPTKGIWDSDPIKRKENLIAMRALEVPLHDSPETSSVFKTLDEVICIRKWRKLATRTEPA